jgi:hypothetical protein
MNNICFENGFQKGSGICLSEQSRGRTFENMISVQDGSQESVNQYLRNNFEQQM